MINLLRAVRRSRLIAVLGSAVGVTVLLVLGGQAGAEHAGPVGKPVLDPALTSYEPKTQVSGSLRLKGSDTMQPLLARLASEFRRRHPGAVIRVEGGGSGAGLAELFDRNGAQSKGNGGSSGPEIFLAASSRELTVAEVNQFTARYGYAPTAVPVAVDAVAVYVHKDNPVSSLSLDQVDAMFSTTRHRGYPQELRRWGQLGLNGRWQNAEIRTYGRDLKSGTRDFIKDHVLKNGDFVPSVHEEPGAASVVLALSRDPQGIAYSGLGLQASSVRTVPLAEHEGLPPVMPNAVTVADESYPLRRFLYLCLNHPPKAKLPPLLQEFFAFVNSLEGQQAVIRDGFYPLPLKQVQQSLTFAFSREGR